MRAPILLSITACGRLSFDPQQQEPPSHLSEMPARATAQLELGDGILDTTTLTLDGARIPTGATFDAAPQLDGPELAVLVVEKLRVPEGGKLRAIGSRPLVVVADVILIEGLFDAGAHGDEPGPGGALPGEGEGAGESVPKLDPNDVCDRGGGGGGFGQPGAAGGLDSCMSPVGAGGAIYGDDELAILIGGSGGGSGSPGTCGAPRPGGAGGGALQLTAYARISIAATGVVVVGGGGGSGGVFCDQNDAGAGSGGGSGGALYLEAPEIDAANPTAFGVAGGGGGGGGNGNTGNGPVGDGTPGGDGTTSGGVGGEVGAVTSGDGGNGGAPGRAPGEGELAEFNPGGGGGAAGRFIQRTR